VTIPAPPGIQGHFIFLPANLQQIRPDYVEAIRAAFAAAPSEPADPPQQFTMPDFFLPAALGPDAPRWSGRFGTHGPDAMVALDGEQAVYAWKDQNSRVYGEGTVTHRGDALSVGLYPGLSLLLEPLPGNALQITYDRGGHKSVTRLDPVGNQ
jgi:hypothetical protein